MLSKFEPEMVHLSNITYSRKRLETLNMENNLLKQQSIPVLLFGAIAVSIAVTHFIFLLNTDSNELFATSFLLWLAIASLLWEKRDNLPFDSGIISTVLGSLLITLVVIRTFSPAGYHLRISPIFSFLGLCLITVKASKLHYYGKEIIILSLLAVGPILEQILELIDLPLITAKFSNFMLWYAGFSVDREGVFILLPTGRVEVYGACSGVASITEMLNIAVLFILLFPSRWYQKIYAVIIAVFIGFMVNAGRVALLAVLVANGNQESFEYWHGGDGSLVFFVISVLLFSGVVWLTILRETSEELDSQIEE